jgi:large subunit ribosomal protein L9
MSQVKLILREDVPKLGDAGDLVSVKPGYARNFLLPKGLASIATASRMKELEHHQRIIAERQAKLLKDLKGTAKAIRAMDLSFEAQVGETGKLFGSVTAANIADRIKEQGIEIDRRKIQLKDAIKEIGDHKIGVRLHKELTVDVTIQVTGIGAPTAADPGAAEDDEDRPVFGGAEDDHFGEEDDDDDRPRSAAD